MTLWHAITAAITCTLFVAAALTFGDWAQVQAERRRRRRELAHFEALLRELRADPERPWRRR